MVEVLDILAYTNLEEVVCHPMLTFADDKKNWKLNKWSIDLTSVTLFSCKIFSGPGTYHKSFNSRYCCYSSEILKY